MRSRTSSKLLAVSACAVARNTQFDVMFDNVGNRSAKECRAEAEVVVVRLPGLA